MTDVFPQIQAAIQASFKTHSKTGSLFLTAAAGLWEMYHGNLPAELRDEYNCRACRSFIERYGAMVTVDSAGRKTSVLWSELPGAGFDVAFRQLREAVEKAEIVDVVVSSERCLGTAPAWSNKHNREWSHICITLPSVHTGRILTAGQRQAELREEFKMLKRGLAEFPESIVAKAHLLLATGGLYRSEKCLSIAKWLLDLHRNMVSGRADALIWRAVATAPTGFCHVRSGMIGTLLEDIANNLDAASIKRRFDEKMDPAFYQRAQVAPSAGNIAQAERIVGELKSAGALSRRYATLSDIPGFLWFGLKTVNEPATGGVFGHITPKAKPTPRPADRLELPSQTMTWDKFMRTVMPTATSIEVKMPATLERFAALVTAVDYGAPPILQWDHEDKRNPVSWYYHGGIDGEMRRRVLKAGGQYENVDIRATLLWNNRNDLDIHVIAPSGDRICYYAKRSRCGGWLDVDMNVSGETTEPVENIRWHRGQAPRGRYQVIVNNYRERGNGRTPFQLELEVNGEVFQFAGVAGGTGHNTQVVTFDYVPGERLAKRPIGAHAVQANPSEWNVTGQWLKCNAIVGSPNLWHEPQMPQHGKHTFFLLDGCRDTSEGLGRGFFVETLRSEYRPIRATLEAFAASAKVEGSESAEACGLGFAADRPWNLTLRVTTDTTTAVYLIDRFD